MGIKREIAPAAPTSPATLVAGPDTWYSSAARSRHALRYGGVWLLTTWVMWLVVGLTGGDVFDPRLTVVALPISGFFIWLALVMYRRRLDTYMGFWRGLGLGSLLAVGTSLVIAASLAVVFAAAGDGLRTRHKQVARQVVQAERKNWLKKGVKEAEYQQQLALAGTESALDIAKKDYVFRMIPAVLLALLGAILFRKANPDGSEPPRPERPKE